MSGRCIGLGVNVWVGVGVGVGVLVGVGVGVWVGVIVGVGVSVGVGVGDAVGDEDDRMVRVAVLNTWAVCGAVVSAQRLAITASARMMTKVNPCARRSRGRRVLFASFPANLYVL